MGRCKLSRNHAAGLVHRVEIWLTTPLVVVVFTLALGVLRGLAIAGCGSEQSELVFQMVVQDGSGPPVDDPQPLHLHFGNCGANLDSVDTPLNDLLAGESVTVIDSTLSELRDGSHVVNLHKSYSEIRAYTACGEIPNG